MPHPLPPPPAPEGSRFPWIAKATDVQLELTRRDNWRWLDLPGAELWAEENADRTAENAAIWTEMQRRRGQSQPQLEDAA